MISGRVATISAVGGVIAYLAWTAAVADEPAATAATIVTAAAFWICLLIVLAYLVGVAVRTFRSRR